MSFVRLLVTFHVSALLWFVTISFISLGFLATPAHAKHGGDPTTIRVNVLSPFSTTQERELLYAFRQSLRDNHNIILKTSLIFWERQKDWQQHLEQDNPNLILVIGDKSYKKIQNLTLNTPVLALMLSKGQFESLILSKEPKNGLYAITHSQPTRRFIQLAKSLNVYQAQVGSFISPSTKYNISTFDNLASFYDLSYHPIMVDPKLNGRDVLTQLTDCCSVVILESDCVFRPGKVRKSILINAYRQRIIVIAHSETILKEGAMLTLFTQPHDVGQQAAELYHGIVQGTLQNPFQYPKNFTININRKVARLLGYGDVAIGKLMQEIKTLDLIRTKMKNRNFETP